MEVIGWVVEIAKSVVVCVAIIFALSLLRRLPERIRVFISAFAAAVLFFALLRKNCVSLFTATPLRISVSFYMLRRMYALALLLACAVVSCCMAGFAKSKFISVRPFRTTRVASSANASVLSCSYIKTSPVLRR